MELSACIVVYNGAEEALRAAQTVLDCTRRHPLTLYLVDNASPDGSGQCLAKAAKDGTLHIRKGQKVEVLCRTENGGFGTGHNTVLSLLQSRVHFILNPDIQLTADTLSDLADWMAQHSGVVMARPALTFPDGRPQRLPLRRCSVRAMVYRQLPCLKFWAKYNERYLMADKDLTKPTEIEFCTGSFSAVDTAVFKAVGGFDEDYFMYVEGCRPDPEDAHPGQDVSGAPVHRHPCMAPRGAPQPEAFSVAAAQPAALFFQVGLCVVTPQSMPAALPAPSERGLLGGANARLKEFQNGFSGKFFGKAVLLAFCVI